jgi:hypothetical protein
MLLVGRLDFVIATTGGSSSCRGETACRGAANKKSSIASTGVGIGRAPELRAAAAPASALRARCCSRSAHAALCVRVGEAALDAAASSATNGTAVGIAIGVGIGIAVAVAVAIGTASRGIEAGRIIDVFR